MAAEMTIAAYRNIKCPSQGLGLRLGNRPAMALFCIHKINTK